MTEAPERRIALVTGAGSGIGRACAEGFAAQGMVVAAVGHDRDEARETVDAIAAAGGEAVAFGAELADRESVAALFDQVRQHWDRLDVVVANAGINGVWAPLDQLSVDDWNHTLSVNLTGTFLTVKHALLLLRAAGGGSVVITSSVNGTRMFSNSGASAYATSKAGQVALAKMLAVELAPERIRVNVICPGSIDTEIEQNTEQRDIDTIGRPADYPEGQIPLTGKVPGTSQQVADLVCFLASDAASHITGTEVWIDGGQSLLAG